MCAISLFMMAGDVEGSDAKFLLAVLPQTTETILGGKFRGISIWNQLWYVLGVNTVRPSPEVEQQLVNPGRTRRHADSLDLVHLAESVMKADQFVRATTGGKLMVIVDQIRALQEKVVKQLLAAVYCVFSVQAREILITAKRDAQLHHAACNFTKVPGKTYHLYEREDETCYFSMLSPQEWGKGCPHKHVGSYRLEYDHSWTPLEEAERRSSDIEAINKVIDAHGFPPSIQYHPVT